MVKCDYKGCDWSTSIKHEGNPVNEQRALNMHVSRMHTKAITVPGQAGAKKAKKRGKKYHCRYCNYSNSDRFAMGRHYRWQHQEEAAAAKAAKERTTKRSYKPRKSIDGLGRTLHVTPQIAPVATEVVHKVNADYQCNHCPNCGCPVGQRVEIAINLDKLPQV